MTAATGALLGAAAPLATADPPPENEVSNYGQCVEAGLLDPSASHSVVGPLTVNKNNDNSPPVQRPIHVGCPRDLG